MKVEDGCLLVLTAVRTSNPTYMEVGSQLQAPSPVSCRVDNPWFPFYKCTSLPVWTRRWRRKFPAQAKNKTAAVQPVVSD
jgi:hypothetical protein